MKGKEQTKAGKNGWQEYEDIMYLPHPVSKKHPQMARQDRAAQFAPFAALTGYQDAVKETVRQMEEKMERIYE